MDTKGHLCLRIFRPSLLVQHGIILLSLVGTVVLQYCSSVMNVSENSTLGIPVYSRYKYRPSLCKWNITVAEGFAPVLLFQTFNIQRCPGCDCSYVEVHDGPDDHSPKLARICGSNLPSPIYASQNRMFVKFQSAIYHSAINTGFNATVSKGELITQNIADDNGTIHSPNYPNNYMPLKRYIWKIRVPENHQIFLEFLTFDLQNSTNCEKDFVHVIDGYEIKGRVLGKLCGTNVVKYMKSSENQMIIIFQTDDSQEARGFVAEFRKAGKCAATIEGTSGYLNSPNYPHDYGPLESCRWNIIAPEDHRVIFKFLSFNVAESSFCVKDFVRIYNGKDDDAPSFGSLCGSRIPNVTESTSNEILVVFKSDADKEAKGFSARFETDFCGEEFNSDNGTFHSPNYPHAYGSNEMCTWKITVPVGYRVALLFVSFRLQYRSMCDADYVRIFDGLKASSPEITRLCGYRGGKFHSTRNTLSARFVTDASNSESGFSALFVKVAIPQSENTDPCRQSLKSDNETITSPGYPGLYFPNLDCTWHIEVPEGMLIRLEFLSFDVEEDNLCRYDLVAVYDGRSTSNYALGTSCGYHKPKAYWSSGNAMTLRLFTDASFEYSGFSAIYSKVDYKNEILHVHSGILKSPNFPNNYGPVQKRVWEIAVPNGYIILLRFLSFELEHSQNCLNDFVEVRERGKYGSVSTIGTFCGATIPRDIRSSSNNLIVVFATDTLEELSGFSARFEKEAICGSNSCRNGGICKEESPKGVPACFCKHGYTGHLCDEKILCSDDTCDHEGTCFQNGKTGLFFCVCAHGYEGVVCNKRISCWKGEICENGGTCTHGGKDGTILCACPDNFEGLFCEKVVEKSNGRIVDIVVPLITVLVIASAVILFLLFKRRRKQQKSLTVQTHSRGSQMISVPLG